MHRRISLPRFAAWGAVVGACAYLLVELVPDVRSKPLFEDEAVSGLISARPFGEMIATTMWDRGGAPLHFVLVHLAFLFDSSPEALRWISVVFAVAAVVLCYDLGRRLDGRVAGVAAAVVAAASGMLAVYGSFGRMYALFAFAAALAVDLFVRCVQRPTTGTVAAASAAAWLLPAVHPYGGIVVAVEAAVALFLWRGRPLRPAWPAAVAVLAMIPFAVADLRLADRFELSSEQQDRLATWTEARHQLEDAVRGFGGGSGWTFVVFLALAAWGIAILLRRRPELVAWGLIAFAGPPLLSTLVRTGRAPDLSPRHLIFALPFFAAFVGVAVARIPGRPLPLVGLAVVAALSTQGINDPRSITYTAALGGERAVSEPAAWLQGEVENNDVLYPYSSVYLAGPSPDGRGSGPSSGAGPVASRRARARGLSRRGCLRRCARRHNRRRGGRERPGFRELASHPDRGALQRRGGGASRGRSLSRAGRGAAPAAGAGRPRRLVRAERGGDLRIADQTRLPMWY